MNLIQVTLYKKRETKNMVLYEAAGEDAKHTATVPNLYVRKTALATAFSKFPEKIKVIIEEETK